MIALDDYMQNLPLIHTWDNGKSWNTGGFGANHLRAIHSFCKSYLPEKANILETGAGNSTIVFLMLNPAKLVSIAPEASLMQRIAKYCDENQVPTANFWPFIEGSQWVLPNMAFRNRNAEPEFDFALIDGCHSFPLCFVDFTYCNALVRKGGFIMVDDLQLHSCKELARYLASDTKRFRARLDIGKSMIFEKITTENGIPGWTESPYVKEMTSVYAKNGEAMFDLKHIDTKLFDQITVEKK